jgi:hypothetical protein
MFLSIQGPDNYRASAAFSASSCAWISAFTLTKRERGIFTLLATGFDNARA